MKLTCIATFICYLLYLATAFKVSERFDNLWMVKIFCTFPHSWFLCWYRLHPPSQSFLSPYLQVDTIGATSVDLLNVVSLSADQAVINTLNVTSLFHDGVEFNMTEYSELLWGGGVGNVWQRKVDNKRDSVTALTFIPISFCDFLGIRSRKWWELLTSVLKNVVNVLFYSTLLKGTIHISMYICALSSKANDWVD